MESRCTIWKLLTIISLMMVGIGVRAQHLVAIDGVVDSPVTLPKLGADSAYIVRNALSVVEGGSLCIEAGNTVYFAQSAYLRVDKGTLALDGQPDDSINLICNEFSHDWAGMQLKNIVDDASVRLDYVKVMGAVTALSATGCRNVTVSHCTFSNYYAGKGLELIDCSDIVVDSCLFHQCVSGIELKARADDSENNRITHNIFNQGQINVEVSNVGYGYKCHNTMIDGNCFQGAATAISFESVGGLSDKDAKNYILNNLISSELPDGNTGYSSYGIKAAMDSLVVRNNIFWSNDEAVRMLRVCHIVFEQNTFYDNDLVMANLLASGSVSFVGNTICEAKKRVVSFTSGLSRMNGNNFLHCKKDVTLFANVSTEEVDMRRNYWGTQSEDEIESMVFHHHDSPTLGEIVYDGFLPECVTNAPVSPPFQVKKQLVNGSWLISWDDNPESDIDHYVLFYGDFQDYKFKNHIDPIFSTSYVLSSQQADNVAVAACDGQFDYDVYADPGQSAYAFATYYPYAGADGEMCAPQTGFTIDKANIPYTYNRFVWRTSGSGVFSDSLSLRTVYYPSPSDFDAGMVTLTLRVVSDGVTKTDAMQLKLFKQQEVYAGEDYYSGLNRPIHLEDAWAVNSDSIHWRTLGDGHFEDDMAIEGLYYPGEQDKEAGFVLLVLEAWSYCGYDTDTVRFELYEEFSLEGRIWSQGVPQPAKQVLAVSMSDDNPFFSGFYRTETDEEGWFRFESLLPDTYVLYAFPDTLDASNAGVYYLGDFQWRASNMIDVVGNVYDVDIDLPPLQQGFATGEGRIAGWFDFPDTDFRASEFYCCPWLRETGDIEFCLGGLSNVGVLLLDASQRRVLGFTLTDEKGAFRFRDLPFGTYHLMADLPRYGRGMVEKITLSPGQPAVEDLHLFVDEGKVAMRREVVPASHELALWSNSNESSLMVFGLNSHEDYTLSITNAMGVVVRSKCMLRPDANGCLAVSMEGLPLGVYVVSVSGKTGGGIGKFVKL